MVYGIPWLLDPRAMIYRTDIFEEAGITEYPRTFDEFADVLRTIRDTHPDIIPFTFAAGDGFAFHAAIGFLIYNGTSFVDLDLNANMLSPEAMEVWGFMQMLLEEGLIAPGTAGYRGVDIELLFSTGEVAVAFTGPPAWLVGTDIYNVTRVMPPIRGPSAREGHGGVNYFWIGGIQGYNTTNHPDEARAFINWWAQNTLDLYVQGNAGPMPVRASAFQHPFFHESWIRTDFYEIGISTGVPVIWPVRGLYPAFMQIDGEGIPGHALNGILAGEDIETVVGRQNHLLAEALENHAHY